MTRTQLAATALTVIALSAGFIGSAQTQPNRDVAPLIFSGSSATADFDEALNNALIQADMHFATIGADIRYNWKLGPVDGERGGFFPLNDMNVTIAVKGQLEKAIRARATGHNSSPIPADAFLLERVLGSAKPCLAMPPSAAHLDGEETVQKRATLPVPVACPT